VLQLIIIRLSEKECIHKARLLLHESADSGFSDFIDFLNFFIICM
jgi:hypothetical protein